MSESFESRQKIKEQHETVILERPRPSLWKRIKTKVIGQDQEMERTWAVFGWPEPDGYPKRRAVNPRPRRHMTQKEVAEYTGLDPATIHRMRRDGTIPGYLWRQLRPHGKVIFDREAFIAWWEGLAGRFPERPRKNFGDRYGF